MPEGSSSAAPVIRPGPSSAPNQDRNELLKASSDDRLVAQYATHKLRTHGRHRAVSCGVRHRRMHSHDWSRSFLCRSGRRGDLVTRACRGSRIPPAGRPTETATSTRRPPPPVTGVVLGEVANSYGHYQGSMSNHDHVYRNVVDVLTKSGVIATNGYEGLKTVEIIDKIYTAAKRAASY